MVEGCGRVWWLCMVGCVGWVGGWVGNTCHLHIRLVNISIPTEFWKGSLHFNITAPRPDTPATLTSQGCLPCKLPLANPLDKVQKLAESNYFTDFSNHVSPTPGNIATTCNKLKLDKQFWGFPVKRPIQQLNGSAYSNAYLCQGYRSRNQQQRPLVHENDQD